MKIRIAKKKLKKELIRLSEKYKVKLALRLCVKRSTYLRYGIFDTSGRRYGFRVIDIK